VRKVLIFFALFFFFVFASAAFFSCYSYFTIKKISIEGNSSISADKILDKVSEYSSGKYFMFFPKDNIFLLPAQKITDNLYLAFPRVEALSLNKNFPDAVFIKIKERAPEALLCAEAEGSPAGGCAFVDGKGFVFEKAPYFSGDIFLKLLDEREEKHQIELRKNIISEDEFKKLIEFKNLARKNDIKISSLILKKDNLYEFRTEEGWRILLNERNAPTLSFENLKIALDSEVKEERKNLDYIDLRFGNKVFYKFK
jgi:hypothetical protein